MNAEEVLESWSDIEEESDDSDISEGEESDSESDGDDSDDWRLEKSDMYVGLEVASLQRMYF